MSEVLTRSQAARYYTDPEVFEIEKRGLLSNTWQFACHASDVSNPGDYIAFEIAGDSLFCIMDQDGEIRTFYNVCQHRAHQLVSGAGTTRYVTCPYHAWTYDLKGALRRGPNLRSVEGLKTSDICLTSVRTQVFLGFVFVNLDPNAAPMEDWFPGAEQELSEWVPDLDRLKPLEWVDVQENCNWKVSIENYSECYHCSINHPAFSTGVISPQTYDIQPQGHCLRHTTECQSLENMSYEIDTTRPNAEGYSSWFLWPMFSFQVYPGNILNTYHWRPIDVSHVEVWRGWYTVDGYDSETVRRLAKQDRATTVEEDIHLVESVQRGLNSRGYKPGPLVIDPRGGLNSEHSISHLQRWAREAIGPIPA